MGLRFRKSISVGKNSRVNLSKSGVGFSTGVKGLRFTRTATGKNRVTASIPGTGISYQKDLGSGKKGKEGSNQQMKLIVIIAVVVIAVLAVLLYLALTGKLTGDTIEGAKNALEGLSG